MVRFIVVGAVISWGDSGVRGLFDLLRQPRYMWEPRPLRPILSIYPIPLMVSIFPMPHSVNLAYASQRVQNISHSTQCDDISSYCVSIPYSSHGINISPTPYDVYIRRATAYASHCFKNLPHFLSIMLCHLSQCADIPCTPPPYMISTYHKPFNCGVADRPSPVNLPNRDEISSLQLC